MIKCLLSRPGLIAGPLHSTTLQINSQSIPRLDPIDSKSSFFITFMIVKSIFVYCSMKKYWLHSEFMCFLCEGKMDIGHKINISKKKTE